MLEVQKFLINKIDNEGFAKDDAFQALTDELGIKLQVHDNFVGLNYDQIESPKSHPIVMECRALVLNRHTLGVARRAFDRFFNHGEVPEFYADFDITRAEVFEKEDGSLIPMWFNQVSEQWEVGTRSMIFAEGDHIMGGTFREKIMAAFGVSEEEFQNKVRDLDFRCTYTFEYVGPSNRIVRRYEKDEMVLLAIRDNSSAQYLSHNEVIVTAAHLTEQGLNVRPVKIYNMGSFDEVLAAIKELPALEEGYVCFDPVSGKRVKLKNPVYTRLHQLRGNEVSLKNFWQLALVGESDEFLVYFPEYSDQILPMVEEINKFRDEIDHLWADTKDIETQKDFAMAVKEHRGSGFLFEARKKNCLPSHVFNESDLNKKLKIFF